MDRFKRELNSIDGMELRFPIDVDADGYIDRECPGEECLFQFKVHEEDWDNLARDEEVFCTMCGKNGPANTFHTTEQVEQAKKQAVDIAKAKVGRALEYWAQDINQKFSGGSFIKIKAEVKGFSRFSSIVPLQALKEFRLKIKCEKCDARFSVIGSAYFCPVCGHSAAIRVFDDSMKKIEAKVSSLSLIKEALAKENEDTAAIICRSLLESALSDGVVAFQRVCEELYKQHTNAQSGLMQNVFQNLRKGSDLWKDLVGKAYEDFLDPRELGRLKILFQRRHLLAHKEGMVDQKYIDNSGDTTYHIGQRIVVNDLDVLDMVSLIKKLVEGYMKELGI